MLSNLETPARVDRVQHTVHCMLSFRVESRIQSEDCALLPFLLFCVCASVCAMMLHGEQSQGHAHLASSCSLCGLQLLRRGEICQSARAQSSPRIQSNPIQSSRVESTKSNLELASLARFSRRQSSFPSCILHPSFTVHTQRLSRDLADLFRSIGSSSLTLPPSLPHQLAIPTTPSSFQSHVRVFTLTTTNPRITITTATFITIGLDVTQHPPLSRTARISALFYL